MRYLIFALLWSFTTLSARGASNGQVVVWDQDLAVNNAWMFNFQNQPGGITNLKSPVDFTQGKIHLTLKFNSVPGVPVYFRIQFYPWNFSGHNPTHYWTDPLEGPVNATGTVDKEYNFSSLQSGGGNWADWTQGIYTQQYSTYDSGNNGINVNYNVHITVTLVPPGQTYQPPGGGQTTPTLAWATPAAITYGAALSATQLNATASVPGSFVYNPASGNVPTAGVKTLNTTFTPTDTVNYTTATATVNLTVNKATPTITWATPAAITYGTALSGTQLNATASVPGSFVYNPASGNVPSAGSRTLSATFTPTDTTNYNTATATVNLTVNKATPTITWATPAAITYGTALSATQLNATASVPGSFVYSPAAGTVPAVGSQTLSATFTPTDATDYTTATGTVNLTVNAAGNQPPTVSLTTPANGANYTAPGSVTLTATAADSDGTIAKVEFYQGATLLGTDTTSPYSYAWTNVTAGSYSLTAKAYDNSGAITTSTAVGITVNAPGNQPPTLSLTAPANGATYTAPASVTLTANAADSDGTITKVEFYQGTILLGTATTSPYRFTWTNVAAGSYSLTAKAYDNGGAITTSAAVGIAVNAVSAPPSGGTGLLGEYYDNMDFTDLKVTRTDATVNFNWGSGSPDPALGADTFSVRWTGQIQAQFSETYTFYTQSDDGVRLWVNGQQLIDNWTNHATVENSGTIALAAGQSYDLKLEYYQNTGGAVASLLWSSPSTPKAGIPQSQLFPAAPAPVTATTTPPASEGKKCGTGTGFAALLAFSFLVLGLRRNRD